MSTRDSDNQIGWGIIATGSIAATIADDLEHVPGARKVAVVSRDLERAREFADAHSIEKAYDDYAEFLADPDIDVVYIATPHGQHHKVTSQVIAAGKPALVEKAFTVSAASAEDLVQQARAADVFVMEAMWARFQPALVQVKQWVDEGLIGEVRAVHADLGFPSDAPPTHRLLDPAKGGGALLDLGVYTGNIIQWMLGSPTSVTTVGRLGPTGVDVEAGVLLGFDGDRHATMSVSLTSASPGQCVIVGTKGRIIIPPRLHHPASVRLEVLGADPVVVENPLIGKGYSHELLHVGQCLAAGLTESPVMPLDDTLAVMRVLDTALDQLGAPHMDDGFTPAAAQ